MAPIVISGNVDPGEAVNKGILEVDMVHNVSVDKLWQKYQSYVDDGDNKKRLVYPTLRGARRPLRTPRKIWVSREKRKVKSRGRE